MGGEQISWGVEILKAVLGLVTAGTAIYGISIAKAGLTKWRTETIGKRKAELAEQVLADFYEARDIIAHARHPLSLGNEGSTRIAPAGEPEGTARKLNSLFVPIERLNRHTDFFARLQASRYRYMALFGKEHGLPFGEIFAVRHDIAYAARELMEMHDQGTGELEQTRDWKKQMQRKIGWVLSTEDEIAPRIDKAVEAVEKMCRPAIEEYAKR